MRRASGAEGGGGGVNAASAFVLAAVVAGAALVVWRNLRKGAPCSCGEDCGCCGRHCHCHADGEHTSHAK